MHHATEQTRTYPCSQCGGQLEFNIRSQKLGCPQCGNVQELLEGGTGPVVERDLRQALHQTGKHAAAEVQPLVSGEKEVVCQNCGGHTTFTGSLTSTRCPYCATPIQREDVHAAPARLPVDGVLPFSIDDPTAKKSLESWISSRWFAPDEFKKYTSTGSFASVYAAYFTYDVQAWTSYTGQRGDNYTVTVGSGENQRTETRTSWHPAAGQVHNSFDDLAILANEGFDPQRVEKLEPWPMGGVRPFSPEYTAGHLSRTYDKGVDACFEVAKERVQGEIDNTIRQDIGGDQQRISSKATTFGELTYKHLLLPIWLLTVIYAQRPFQVVINGATGEVHGERPYSKVKIAMAVALAVIVAVIIAVLYLAFGR